MKSKLLLLLALLSLTFNLANGQTQLSVGQKYQCFLEDYANKYYDWINISWEISSGLNVDYAGTYVRTVSFSEYRSGTYSVTVKWTETDMSDPFDPFRHKSHTWYFTCKNDGPIPVEQIKLNYSVYIFTIPNQHAQLNATITPSNATNKTVTWSSSNTSVATVSSTGYVTSGIPGNATITCKATDGSGVKATCGITVLPIYVDKITLNASSASLNVGDTKLLTATVTPNDATNKAVTWSSSNTSVATVSSSGLVTAKAAGSVTITCNANDGSGVSATCSVTVKEKPIPVTKITLNASSATLNVGDTKQLSATITPSNATNKTVTWTSSNTSVATVSSTGLVTAKAAGSATITCKANDGSGVSATCQVTVNDPAPKISIVSVTSSNTNLTSLTQDDKLDFRASFKNTGKTAKIRTVLGILNKEKTRILYRSAENSSEFAKDQQVTINYTYSLKNVPAGEYYATVLYYQDWGDKDEQMWYYGSETTLKNITVKPSSIPVTKITLNASSTVLAMNDTKQLTATITPSNATNQSVTWTSSNINVATVSSSGLVTAKAAGSANITCKANDGSGIYATCTVTVSSIIHIKSITLDRTSLSLEVGGYYILSPTILPTNATVQSCLWSSSNPDVASVGIAGFVSAKAVGNTIITCKANDGSGVTTTCNVTVTNPSDNYIYIDNVEANPGSQLTLSLKMKNKVKIRGFQFDLYLPSGVTAVKNDKGRIQAALSGRRDSGDEHTLTVGEQADGAIRFLCGSQYDETFTGNDGEVATLTVNIAESMKKGAYSIILKNIKLTETDISKYYETSEKRTTLTIKDYILGDVNGDGKVDVSDYIGVANRIMGIPQEIFIEKAGDVDVNGVIDVSDYIGVANIIMTGNIYSSSNSREAVPAGGPAKVSSTDVSTISNVIYMPQLTVDKGATTAQLSLHMKNKARIRGFQFDLYLPNGITAAKNNKGRIQASLNKNRLESDDEHTLTVGEQADGAIRFLCGSQYDETFTGSDGEVMTLTVNIASGLASGDYPVTLKNIKLTETDISKYYETESIVGVLTIEGATLTGDVNGDGKVNGTDLVALARMILGMDSKNSAADVNKDGTVNGTDYTALVNIIMGRSAAVRGAANDASAQMATLHMDPFTISAGETKEMTISLTNRDAALTLVQFDILLPKGLSVVQANGSYQIDMAGRTNWDNHQLGAYGKAERMRFLLASGSNELIEGTEGAIIRMNVRAAEDFEGGTITLNDILGVTPNEVEVWMPTSSYTLTGNGTTGIYGIGAATDESVIYDLSGHRQQTMKKGVNIVGGKKMIKK